MTDDAELLRRYAGNRDEAAFAELVRRHLGLVYHAALRQCGGDAHRAEDVAQTVFTDLARKAGKLARRPVLAGWLYTSTRYAAAQAVRGETRRQAREQEAQAMNEIFTQTNSSSPAETVAEWERLRPVIDDALHALGERDREAVLLRFFEGRPFAEVGAKLFLTEDAARMRVERALEKLRAALVRRGITSTTAALGVALANQATATAPAGVAAGVTSAALAGAATSGATGALVAFLTMSKINVGIVSAIVVAVTVTGVVELRANRELRAEIGALLAAHNGAAQLQQENRQLNATLQKVAAKNPEADELLQLRARAALLKARPEGVTDEQMKLATACQNVGRATPTAAIETLMWAATSSDIDTLMRGYFFTDDVKAKLPAFFASQSEVVRTRYGTPERLLGELWQVQKPELPAAFQVLDVKRSFKSEADTAKVGVWWRNSSDQERGSTISFQRGEEGWGIVAGNYSDEQWAKLAARIDQVTGALHATGK